MGHTSLFFCIPGVFVFVLIEMPAFKSNIVAIQEIRFLSPGFAIVLPFLLLYAESVLKDQSEV